MNLQQATLERLHEVSGGALTKQAILQLALPNSDELYELAYLATRLKPTMPKYKFSSAQEALSAIAAHYAYHGSVTARICNRSSNAIEALLLGDETKQSVVINPFTYGVPQDGQA